MRVSLICWRCGESNGQTASWFIETIREDGLYTGKCPNGHDLLIGAQTLPHEMLFEIALNAIVDGYNREAVSSFAASMERYFEFAIRVITHKCGVADGTFTAAWKTVSNQSERQLGGYILLYLAEFGTQPPLISDKMTKLRNGVIHKGNLPDKNDAIAFGKAVHEIIQEGILKLRSELLDDVHAVLDERIRRIAEKMGDSYPRSFQATSTALNVIADTSGGYESYEQILRRLAIPVT